VLALATTFRDAFAILDVIGWLPTPQTIAVEVEITPSHLAQLEHRRVDLEQSISEQLDGRQGLAEPDDIVQADEFIEADRVAADGLLRILRAGTVEPDAG
jgi:phosphopantothenoylcysteine synthetase/decarboxylase